MTVKKRGLVRAYVHYFDDPDGNFWMVDNGPQDTGIPVKRVEFSGCSGRMVVDETIMLSEARELDRPKAWFEVVDATLVVDGDQAMVVGE